MKTNKGSTGADARVLGRILAAQNIEFVLPNITHIAEFFAETLMSIPGVLSCRVCLEDISIQRGEIGSGICEECVSSRRKSAEQKELPLFNPDFKCRLADHSGVQFNAINSLHHHFGYFVFQIDDPDVFNVYKPFIVNLANYVAISLENRQQRDLLQKAHDDLEHKVEKRTQELRASNEAIKDLYNNAPCGYHSLDKDGIFILVNDTELQWLGYSRDETVGKVAFQDLLTADGLKTFETNFQSFKERGWVSDLEFEMVRKDGTILPVLLNATAINDDNGNYVMSRSTIFDITARKQAGEKLQERERHSQSLLRLSRNLERSQTYAEVLNAAQDEVRNIIGYQNLWAYLLTDDKKHFKALVAGGLVEDIWMTDENATMLTITGDRMLEEIAEANEIVVVEDAQTDERTDKDIVASFGNRTIVNIPIILFDKHLGTVGTGTFGDEGVRVPAKAEQEYLMALASHMAVSLDRIHLLNKRRQAEQSLRESEERFRSFVEKANDIVYTVSPDGVFTYVSPNWKEILGHEISEVEGKSFEIFVHPDDLAACREILSRTVASGEKQSGFEYRVKHKNGNWQWHTSNASVIRDGDGDGNVVSFLGIARDITERRQGEDALRRSEQKFRALAENIPNVVYQCKDDSRYTFIYLNNAVEDLTGYSKEEFLENGLSFFDLYHPDDLPKMPKPEDNHRSLINRRSFHITYRIHHRSGEWRWVDEWGTGVMSADSDVEYLEGIMIDITENKHHELEREAIIMVSAALRQAATKTEILNVLLDQLVKLFDVDGAMLVLPHPQTEGLINEMGRGVVAERMIGLRIPPGRGVSDWVIKNKKTYLNNYADSDTLFYRADLLGDSHCLASVPLITQELAIGAVWIVRRMDILEQDLRMLVAIADIAANAIHRVMLHEQTELQLNHLIALHQIDLAISANFDSTLTLNIILKNVKNELEVDAASILLLNPVTHTLDYAAGVGFKTQGIEQSQVKIGDEWSGRAAREYQTVSCPDLNLARPAFRRFALLANEAFVAHYATPLVIKGQVKGVLELFHRKTLKPMPEWIDYFETLATQTAIAIESSSLLENLQRSNMELILAYDATIEGWSRALDLRDRETEGHTQRVVEMALDLASKMGMSEAEKQDLRRGALLHDIGKMGIPDSILLKPGPLSDEEKEFMQIHPTYAYQMLSPISYLKHALEIPYCHHEKWDGSGYPRGLKGKEIPLSARLFAVVDVFDALATNRPYRAAWGRDDVYRYIKGQVGKHFDPQIVKIFLDNETLRSQNESKI